MKSKAWRTATLASMAVSDGAVFIRSERHLYRIQEKAKS